MASAQAFTTTLTLVIIFIMLTSARCGELFCAAARPNSTTLLRDVLAIKAFKKAVFDPLGALEDWTGDDPCNGPWKYIECSDASLNKTIIQLSLSNLQLGGNLPSSLQVLSELKSLDLGNNDFHGQIPKWIGKLTKLMALDLQSNDLDGAIPRELGKLNELFFLRITNNSLSGSLPEEFGKLSSLKILACENNFLSGPFPPSLMKLTNISHLHMDHNQFTGSLPDWLGQFSELVHLVLNDNLIVGSLPSELGNCFKLQQLKLDNNLIEGPIPATFGFLTALVDMRIHNNSLSGFIPTAFNNLISLHVLDLGANNLQGSIPNNMGNLESLVFLNLEKNKLSGIIPSSFAEFSTIEIINLCENKLKGIIPDLGLSSNLYLLELEDNLLTGLVPPSLRKTGLELLLHGNPLCSEATNKELSSCSLRHHLHAMGSMPSTCICPSGMILRSLYMESQNSAHCDCVAPLLIELFFPRVLFQRCTSHKQERLGSNLARELYLESWQVIVQSVAQNDTGTDAIFLILPVVGLFLDSPTLMRIKKKLYAPYLSAVWFDGEFGWFDYTVLQFIMPLGPGEMNRYPSEAINQSSPRPSKSIVETLLIIVSSIIGGIGVLLALLFTTILLWRRRLRNKEPHHIYKRSHNVASFCDIELDPVFSGSCSNVSVERDESLAKIFTMDELNICSRNFCSKNLIATGGSGAVYRGTLQDGTAVAIKKLWGLAECGDEEFQNEIQMSRHRHGSSHLMQLLGYCAQQDERVLVYELMPHGSLLDYLKGGRQEYPVAFLDWRTRIQIALDTARGLRHLHESNPPVVHRDVKPSNILLDENFHAKVADFGLSKVFLFSESSHVTTRVIGTFGYLAPDYSMTGKLTVKSDVYSFGAVLLELLSGQNILFLNEEGNTDFLIPWAKPLLKHEKTRNLVIDPGLRDECPTKAAELMVGLILSCLELDPDRRPKMITVESILDVISDIPITVESNNNSA
ncbi:hypothetical protein GOP47_0010507 [Adiantum capillus-veneris]|uniref:Protein kinase domain-containing protein n=1 Tax=Adiantum capillus-veneris TaxID=13818 RepID=A0A9D4ZIT7_ADICA|nr:hypothetical protein GOP47_0010507 [Adiantum capillus-veneris]